MAKPTHIAFDEQELRVTVRGREHVALLRTPAMLAAEDPALLINLASDVRTTLGEYPYCVASNVFLAAGHRVVSFDMPCHGDWKCSGGDQLVGIAAAMAAGQDPYIELGEVGRAMIDACVGRKLARAGRVVACGTSRGGLGALHVLAADERVSAAAMFAPVTELTVLNEFAHLAGAETAKQAAALSLVERVLTRPVAITINTDDARVSTRHCLQFHAALRARWPLTEFPLRVFKGDTHRVPDAGYQIGAAFLLEHCARTTNAQG